ncbi:MAG: alpha-amylase [Deltaproteobacteria bacterium]|nr:alpha-amylase [Deltaproteobacteria bacterium]
MNRLSPIDVHRCSSVVSFLPLCVLLLSSSCVDPSEVRDRSFVTPMQVDDWRDEIIYQIMVDRFQDGDPNNDWGVDRDRAGSYHGGDWQGIIDRLGYLETLGVTALWISPVVKNLESDAGFGSYHGYWAQDFVHVNPHFGDLAKLRELVDECHKRDMKVILDIVTNHIGQLFFYDINGNGQADDFLIGGGGTAYGSENHDFYAGGITRTTEWDPDYDSRGIQAFTSLGESGPAPVTWVYDPAINRMPAEPSGFDNPTWYNRRGRVTVWRHEGEACCWVLARGGVTGCDPSTVDWWGTPECRDYIREQELRGDFPGGLKDLDTTRQDVRDALFAAYAHWLTVADFDGFRIDTLKHVEREFWQDFCPRIRQHAKALGKRQFFMFGEAFDGHDDLLASYVGDGQVDSVFYFSQKYRVFENVFGQGRPTAEIESLFRDRLGDPDDPAYVPLYPDTPNPDGPIDAEGNPVSPRKLLVNFLDNHDVGRFRYLWNDARVHHNALFLLLTEDGIPCIYYGTEQGFDGGNDPANREDMAGHFDTAHPTFRTIQALIRLRKQYLPLQRGDLRIVWASATPADGGADDAGIFAFERTYRGETVLVVVNSSNEANARPFLGGTGMATSFAEGTALVNSFCQEDASGDWGAHVCRAGEGQRFVVGPGGSLGETVQLPPRSGLILVPAP